MNITAKWNEDKTGVNIFGEVHGFVPKISSEWITMGIDVLEKDGHIEEFLTDKDIAAAKAISERSWRNGEIDAISHMINIIEDESDTRASSLRKYRIDLRNYPQQDDFPFGDRPVRPK